MENSVKNVDSRVEVIIVEMDPLYTERCRKSLTDQTCKTEKITVVNPEEDLVKAAGESCSGHIYIVKNTDVLSGDVLEKLITSPDPDFSGSVCLYERSGELKEEDADKFSVYYRLIPVSVIKNAEYQALTGLSSLEEQASFLLSLAEKTGSHLSVVRDSVLYGKNEYRQQNDTAFTPLAFKFPYLLKVPEFQDVLIKEKTDSETCAAALGSLNDIYGEEGVSIASLFKLYKKYFMPVCKKVTDGKASEEEYDHVKSSFKISEGKDEKAVLSFMTGINDETLRCMDILGYEDFSSCLADRILTKDQLIKEKVVEKTIVEKETVEVPVISDNTISPQEIIDSIDSAEYTVKAYRTGRLGFKTIFSSIKAWFAHKFRR